MKKGDSSLDWTLSGPQGAGSRRGTSLLGV